MDLKLLELLFGPGYLDRKILLPLKFLEFFIRMFIIALKLKGWADFYHCHDISPMIVAWLAARTITQNLSMILMNWNMIETLKVASTIKSCL